MGGNSDGTKVPPDKFDVVTKPSVSTTSAWALGGPTNSENKMRSFAEIIA